MPKHEKLLKLLKGNPDPTDGFATAPAVNGLPVKTPSYGTPTGPTIPNPAAQQLNSGVASVPNGSRNGVSNLYQKLGIEDARESFSKTPIDRTTIDRTPISQTPIDLTSTNLTRGDVNPFHEVPPNMAADRLLDDVADSLDDLGTKEFHDVDELFTSTNPTRAFEAKGFDPVVNTATIPAGGTPMSQPSGIQALLAKLKNPIPNEGMLSAISGSGMPAGIKDAASWAAQNQGATVGLGALGAANIGGLFDNDQILGQAGGLAAGFGGAIGANALMGAGLSNPAVAAIGLGGGTIGMLLDKLRAKKLASQGQEQPMPQPQMPQ